MANIFETKEREVPSIPGFDLIRPIGRGGFGEVWLAVNQTTRQLRAIKLIPTVPTKASNPAGREIMSIVHMEANLRRQHANLIMVHHVGQCEGYVFLVMDLADNVNGDPGSISPNYRPATLQNFLDASRPSPEQCWEWTRELISGLAVLHGAGMVHRDVKPANCLFVGGELKLADFGLVTNADRHLSQVGTAIYMPPDGCMDMRADIYAAGLTIYEMTTGLPPYRFPSLGEGFATFADSPILLQLNRLVLQACHPVPSQRFCNAQEMLRELQNPVPANRRRTFRWRAGISLAIACILVVLLAAIIYGWSNTTSNIWANFVTTPFEATIELDGKLLLKSSGTPYTTPCTILNLPHGSHRVVFKKSTFGKIDMGLVDFKNRHDIEYHAAPRPKQSIPSG
ncbi:MAG: serine/threonine protein kinase [Planctomycetaceae bacterium]|nr:serine/threonine protein kinase [Planctomycetaceae bacterium]